MTEKDPRGTPPHHPGDGRGDWGCALTDPVFIAMRRGIEAEVCIEIARRQEHGIAKYGTTVADNPLSLRQWLVHAFEEALDQAIYLKRAIAEIDAQELRDIDDMVRAGKSVVPEDAGGCGNVGHGCAK